MNDKLETFVFQIPKLEEQAPAFLIDYFVYYFTIIEGYECVQASDINNCFDQLRLKKYSNTSSYLARNLKASRGKKPKFIKSKKGYQLERTHQLDIQKTLHSGPAKIETSHLLRKLLIKLPEKNEQLFLQEAIDCYEIGARRAAIVMVWILTIFHLYKYIFNKELSAFNSVLLKNTDKRVKIKKIINVDDFSEIPEVKFIEFARSAKIISNDVRKILDTKLGVRNTSAHPSAVTISEVKATDFIIDLVNNVILKYKI